MRATVTKFSTSSMAPMSTVALNRIGAVNDTGISCSAMVLNAVAGEYVQQIDYSWDDSQIQFVQIVSSSGNVLSRGNYNGLLTSSLTTFSADRPLLAFWGTRTSNSIVSVGSVTVDPVCIKGTTPVNGN